MPEKDTSSKASPRLPDMMSALQPLAPIAWMSTAWIESLADLGTEVTSFVADRIREDVKTQHAILHCKSLAELQHVQAQFMQRAIDQYTAETGKLVGLSTEIAARIKNTSQTE